MTKVFLELGQLKKLLFRVCVFSSLCFLSVLIHMR